MFGLSSIGGGYRKYRSVSAVDTTLSEGYGIKCAPYNDLLIDCKASAPGVYKLLFKVWSKETGNFVESDINEGQELELSGSGNVQVEVNSREVGIFMTAIPAGKTLEIFIAGQDAR